MGIFVRIQICVFFQRKLLPIELNKIFNGLLMEGWPVQSPTVIQDLRLKI